MRFETAQAVENVVWGMRLADFPRSQNRALINQVANGSPPYTEEEQVQNRITTNVNYLDMTNIAHSARRQFSNAFLNVDPAFTVALDYGPIWKRREWSQTITEELAKPLRRSLLWYEMRRSVFASDVLHGIGPSVYKDRYSWCQYAIGVEDVLVPGDTLLTMENLPMFALYRKYTAMQLYKFISGPRVDPGWDVDIVKTSIKYLDQQSRSLMGASWPEMWSPEKWEERMKSDGALYSSDAVPTLGVYDLYYWSDDEKECGWRRRMVIDAWGDSGIGGGEGLPVKNVIGSRNQFIYTSRNRVYAKHWNEIIHWQFADASSVAPFRYHSVRSLGFLLYAICHLQNRLRCKFNDAVFESLLQYFRVSNPADAERLTQVDLVDKGIIPEGLEFVRNEERWQVNEAFAERALMLNRQTMADNSVSFTQDYDFGSEQNAKTETATRTQAKITATAALVGSMLNQAYKYEEFRFQEMARRFCIPESKCPDVRAFRLCCIKRGVPEEAFDHNRWHVVPVKVIGNGDKQLQIANANALMNVRPLLDPTAQKRVIREYISANTEDYDLAKSLVPEVQGPTKSGELGTFAAAALLQGLPFQVEEGIDLRAYIESLLNSMEARVNIVKSKGGVGTPDELAGFDALANHIMESTEKLAQDPAATPLVKNANDILGKMMNEVKAFAQRMQEQMQQQGAPGQPGADPQAAAKAQAAVITAQTKAKLQEEAHAQRTAQRQIQFEQKVKQDEQRAAMEIRRKNIEADLDLKRKTMEVMAELEAERRRLENELAARRIEAEAAIEMERQRAQMQIDSEKQKADIQVETAKKKARTSKAKKAEAEK